MRNINVFAKKMARNGLKIANSLGCAFRFESDFSTYVSGKHTYIKSYTYLCRTYSIFKVALDYDLNSFFSSNLNQIQTWVKFEKGLLFVYWFENLHIPSYFGSQISLKPSLGYYFLIIAFILHINSKFLNQPMLRYAKGD